jgi:predicted ATPase/class 3 adenylate cyclase
VETPTLLFTDIEGSTALYEQAGEIFRQALAQHHAIIRHAVAEHGGRSVRDTGDGIIAAFADPQAAVACAIAAQEALHHAAWPEAVGPLRVRMGLHRGPAEFIEDDYRGLTMHHAARVMSAAHGGQILCSPAVAALLPPGSVSLSDLGLYRLRGLPQPMRLSEICWSSGRAFPAPNAPPAFTHRLPRPATRYFGRTAEITELAQMLRPESRPTRGRLVTLLGPGGNGKTRLSLEVATRLLPTYSHAVWFVSLAELHEARLVLEKIREALGLVAASDTSPLEQCARFLAAQPSLLVLDNFEQLLPDGAAPVAELLAAAPTLACLVTSRVRLELGSEQEFTLAPLRLPAAQSSVAELRELAAVQLFLDRAQAVRRGFALTTENAAALAQLCRALEGIPLALELAAARASMLTPQQMLGRLSARLDFLAGARRDTPERHRTLRAAIAWSYELLPGPLQRLFARLSVFRGGWTLEAAEAIAPSEDLPAPRLLDALTQLHGCSLILATESDGVIRYGMYEMLRDYAAERLADSAERAALENRHHAYYFAQCQRMPGEEEAAWHGRVATEIDNIRALLGGRGPQLERLRAAVCLYPYWMHRGTLREGREWLGRLRAEVGPITEATGAAAANAAAILAWKAGDHAAAQEDFAQALAFWRQQGHEVHEAGILNNLAILADDVGDLPRAHEYLRRSEAIYRRTGARPELAAVLINLGENARRRGDAAAACAALEEAMALSRDAHLPSNLADALHNRAELHLHAGEFAAGRRCLAESFTLRAELGSEDHQAAGWLVLGEFALAEQRWHAAARCFLEANRALEKLEARPAPEFSDTLQRRLAEVRACLPAVDWPDPLAADSDFGFGEILRSDGSWVKSPPSEH